jgi:CIC family chloride channel protein
MEPPAPQRPSPAGLDPADAARASRRLAWLRSTPTPLDLRIVGRTLLHAAIVGAAAGLVGSLFFASLEWAQRLLLERVAGYAAMRAHGEVFLTEGGTLALRPWLLALLPAAGALVSGLLTSRLAPEAAGGGGDATIESYHRGGVVRRRLVLVKGAAAVATLASGGSGGREGPTMQIGGALGAWVARSMASTPRERRVLMVAGIAAGISAVFRTPLGAALLATEMLYRDDFESDALVPAILASVVAYSVVISILGQAPLFGSLPRFAFVPAHLALYAALAIVVALGAVSFVATLRAVQRASARSPLPPWARPAAGGLAMGVLGTAIALALLRYLGAPAARVGVFGGGYGVMQVALTGGEGLPAGWALVALLAALGLAKMIASSLTIGTGAAAGDFAPSLVMGALLGGAFGHAAALVLGDARIDPSAFALVGMGTFYGGIAHAPLAAVVLVCELAGSYDLLVPMMLAVSTALLALRSWSLYAAQPRTRADARGERGEDLRAVADALGRARARDLLVAVEVEPVLERTPIRDLLPAARAARNQRVLVAVGAAGEPRGLIDVRTLLDVDLEAMSWTVAADLMEPYAAVAPDDAWDEVLERLQGRGLSQIAVAGGGVILGFVGEPEILRAFVPAARAGSPG